MRNTDSPLRFTGAWFLPAIGTSFSTVARAGQGVWTSGGPPDSGTIRALAVNPATPSRLYAAPFAGSAVIKSTDSGGTWAAASTGITSPLVGTLAIADPARRQHRWGLDGHIQGHHLLRL